MSNEFVPIYDLDSLGESQRQDYIRSLCKHLGIPADLNLIMLTYIDSNEGPRRLVPYAKRGAAEIIRHSMGIDIVDLSHQMVGGSIVFKAVGKNAKGRQEIATGSKYIEGLIGQDLDDAVMTATTRAIRRMTLQFIGGGVLDESEVTSRGVTVSMKSESAQLPAAQPTGVLNSEPGKDITETPLQKFQKDPNHDMQKCIESNVPCGNIVHDIGKFTVVDVSEKAPTRTQEEFETHQAKLRADAIAQLNKKAEEEKPAEKPRKKRGRKAKIDLGPSEPVQAKVEYHVPSVPATLPANSGSTLVVTPAVTPEIVPALKAAEPAFVPTTPVKPQLTAAEVQPYRNRLFRLMNDYLEPNGFAPSEGLGNADKMRNLAGIMFGITNLKELTAAQWEQYLSTLENKVKTDGPVVTIKYIEETIGL